MWETIIKLAFWVLIILLGISLFKRFTKGDHLSDTAAEEDRLNELQENQNKSSADAVSGFTIYGGDPANDQKTLDKADKYTEVLGVEI